MQYDLERAEDPLGANCSPCPTRRGIITGIATLAATASLARRAAIQMPYDETLHYLHHEFLADAERMRSVEGKIQVTLFQHMTALATALSVIPSAAPRAEALKREVATWSMEEGRHTLRLPSDLVAALLAPN